MWESIGGGEELQRQTLEARVVGERVGAERGLSFMRGYSACAQEWLYPVGSRPAYMPKY